MRVAALALFLLSACHTRVRYEPGPGATCEELCDGLSSCGALTAAS